MLPETITYIPGSSFNGYSNLKKINTENIEKIGGYVFVNALDGAALRMPKLSTIEGNQLFYNSGVTILDFRGSTFTNTKDSFAQGATNLHTVYLSDTLTGIGYSAFQGCTSLSSVNFPSSLTTISNSAFNGCTSLEIEDLALPNLETIDTFAFYGVKITKISNLGKLTSLRDVNWDQSIFGDKTILTSVNLPPTLTSIGNYVFSGYTALASVNFPSSLTRIGTSTFNGCTSLVNVTFPASLTTINGTAFSGCTSLEIEDLSLPNLEVLGNNAFNGVKISKVSNLGKITTINPNIGDKSVLREITLPNTIKTIGNQTFHNCSALETITIESGASGISVGNLAFCNLPSSVNFNVDLGAFVSLGKAAFRGIST